jgi:Tol biopolymer transport system component
MRRWYIILLILLALLIASSAFLLWRIPRLLEVSPTHGTRRVSAGEPLHLRFSRHMQTDSIAAHLQIEPAREGTFAWEENTLSFTPDTPWPSGITVTVRLKAGAYAAGFPALPTTSGKSWSFSISKPLLAYLWPANLPADIYALDPVSGETLRVTEGANVQDFSVSADGTTLYYSAITGAGKADLYRLNWREAVGTEHQVETGKMVAKDEQKQATGTIQPPGQSAAIRILACLDANCHAVQISPTGEYLAYERIPIESPGQPAYPQVWLLSMNGGEPVLAGNPVHETILPDWSSSGKLAFYDTTAQAFVLLDPRSQETRLFLNQTGEQGDWTANGQAYVAPEITFVTTLNTTEIPNSRLLRFDWATSQITDLTGAANLEDSSPAFSPDGKRLAFARRSLDPAQWTIGRQLWLSESDGNIPHPLLNADLDTLDSFSHYDFAWKSDSSQLAYVRSNQDYPLDPPELWLVEANGLNRVQLVVGGYAPQWVQ